MGIDEKTIERAVSIWVTLLRDPQYDNGDKSFAGFVTRHLAEGLKRNNSDDVLARFGEELTRIIAADERSYIYLGVDYSPCQVLHDAAQAAGLEMEFPWKTGMSIEPGIIKISCGYAAPVVVHKLCDDGAWSVGSDERAKQLAEVANA